ncbi:hypothetical protein TSTA_000860 [Talaromyces stipitatus ATCC 10500]|uniref:HTH CENPB-type domain-containing protein n=1 Tax=Talaromyces stipitatus (strain ATCC 10500 / CBS 375.48 / QM 6759 / NRRL 1006) TaxID=441959 RepID=B8MSV5_TALSN|nr:uncharacterized protein TSTA_000860 [Talaromyces stipitatus ATCC 10500]EED12014.1 hypothetical protein TSTA_000860 [Talaromyces stipitatus ATCC 10500]
MIRNYAQKVLQNMHPGVDDLPQLGDRWVHRFLKRLPTAYKKQKQKTIDPKRHLAEDLNIIQAWFDRLEIAIRERAINEQAHLGGFFYDKIDFLANIARVRAEAFTPRIIRKGFSDWGLWPLNLDIVVDPLMEKWDIQMGQDLQIFDGDEEQDIPSSPTNASFSPLTTAYKL